MKTIGFIDYYIDQWHAHNYPRMIRQSAAWAGQFDVTLAWAQTDPPGKMPLAAWCAQNEVGRAESMQQVVESCDCLVVLSPDHADKHEELADLALRSGKPTYIDKPIAPTRAAAERLFDKARQHQTPIMSCSALRFAPPLVELAESTQGRCATSAMIRGGGVFEIYAIHQVEMLVMLLGCGATAVRRHKKADIDWLAVDYGEERFGTISLMPGHPFEFSVRIDAKTTCSGPLNDFFPRFIDAMLRFFATRQSPVDPRQTLEIAGIVEAGMQAKAGISTSVPRPR